MVTYVEVEFTQQQEMGEKLQGSESDMEPDEEGGEGVEIEFRGISLGQGPTCLGDCNLLPGTDGLSRYLQSEHKRGQAVKKTKGAVEAAERSQRGKMQG